MRLKDSVIVVTGGASGIGAAMCERFAQDAPRAITVVDLDGDGARAVSERIAAACAGVEVHCAAVDVSVESQVADLISEVNERDGLIDLFCGNAGIATGAGIEASDEVWRRIIDVNVMAHVYAMRALLPGWLERGSGHFVVTASAAGLLSNLGDAPYSVTKHGAVALAEWLSITYGDRGIAVACLCPQGVRTPLLFPEMRTSERITDEGVEAQGLVSDTRPLALEVVKGQRLLEPEDVADMVVAALEDGRFLILPHEEVAAYEQARANDRERWLSSMRRLQAKITGG